MVFPQASGLRCSCSAQTSSVGPSVADCVRHHVDPGHAGEQLPDSTKPRAVHTSVQSLQKTEDLLPNGPRDDVGQTARAPSDEGFPDAAPPQHG